MEAPPKSDLPADSPADSPVSSVANFLATVEMLSPFTREEIERLAEHAQSRFFAFGETVCNAGDVADGLFVIKAGSVRIFTEEHGKEISMGVRKERRSLRRHRDAARIPARIVGAFFGARPNCCSFRAASSNRSLPTNPAALAFVTSYVAINSAGGFVAQSLRSARQAQQDGTRRVRAQRRREARRRGQGDPQAGLARRPATLRRAAGRSAHRAQRGQRGAICLQRSAPARSSARRPA